jgi:Protein of unknown function (DUF2380)
VRKVVNELGGGAGARVLPIVSVLAALAAATIPAALTAEEPNSSEPVKLAVFTFELEDASPDAVLLGKSTDSTTTMEKVTESARRELAQSGRYKVVDVSAADEKPVADRSLRNCDGCEAAIALRLGADQSLLGVVIRATQTDYYVLVRIRDARSGKIVNQQEANFAGSTEGWPSGARMLIKHQILASLN